MNPDYLQLLYQNTEQYTQLKQYFADSIYAKAAEAALAGNSVQGIPDAKKIIDSVFDSIEEKYYQAPQGNTNNPAR